MRCILPACVVVLVLTTIATAQPPAKLGPAFEQEPYGRYPLSDKLAPEMAVADDAAIFPEEAVSQAKKKVASARHDFSLNLTVATHKEIPADRKEGYSKPKEKEFFRNWAAAEASAHKIKGVYVLICMSPGWVQVIADKESRERGFDVTKSTEIFRILNTALLDAAKKGQAEQKGELRGKALVDVADFFSKQLMGTVVTQFTLINKNGVVLKCIEYGAIITELHVPDKDGKMADVVLGFDKLEDYMKGHPYFGANAGRCANRIGNAHFKIGKDEYTVTKPGDGPHTLHGGAVGFDKKIWRGTPFLGVTGPGVKFQLVSPDGDEGYPGRLTVSLSYTLTDENELVVEYRATTDKTTVCNLAHHSYFNLGGQNSGTILNEEAQIFAKNYTPGDDSLITTGRIEPVSGTPFDFTSPKPMGKDLKKAGGKPVGFDLNYVLDKGTTVLPALAARVTDPKSDRVLEVFTTEPGLQFYTGNFLDGSNVGKGGAVYKQYSGFCMEPQKFPDSVNKPEWSDRSNPILKPGETYRQTTVYKFGVVLIK